MSFNFLGYHSSTVASLAITGERYAAQSEMGHMGHFYYFSFMEKSEV
jgi:hypothetical protein